MSKPARKRYVRIVTPVGVAVYPHLLKPDTKFDAAGVFSTKLKLTRADAADLIETLTKIRDEAFAEVDPIKRKKLTLADVYEEDLDDEGNETGFVIIKAKMKHTVTKKDGETFTQSPRLFDADNNVASPADFPNGLWGGSKLAMECEVVPFEMAQSKQFGITLRLRAVQVVEVVEGGGGESPFGKRDGFTKPKFPTTGGSATDDTDDTDDEDGDNF